MPTFVLLERSALNRPPPPSRPSDLRTALLLLALLMLSLSASWTRANDLTPPAAQSKDTTDPLLKRLTQIDCPQFDRMAADYQQRFLAPMKVWSIEHLSRLGSRKVIYPFSGPDVITALALFDAADHLILVADQAARIDWGDSTPRERIQKECQTQHFFSRLGYFRTNDLEGKGSVPPRFTKMLVYSILISGSSVERVVPLRIGREGQVQVLESAIHQDGLRFLVRKPDGRRVTVDYLSINLANAHLQADSPKLRFLSEQMAATVLLKSASHLPQKPHFSVVTELMARRALAIVQDETGLDIELLRGRFKVLAHGSFVRPHPLWKDSASAARLKDFLVAQPAMAQLPFVMGYEKPSGSIVLVASRPQRSAEAAVSLRQGSKADAKDKGFSSSRS